MNISIETKEQCEKVLTGLKEKGYMLFWSQYSWDHPEGFLMCFTSKEGQVTLKTTDKDIQKMLLGEGHWMIKN